MIVSKITREQFVNTGQRIGDKRDSFHKTFIRKADLQNLWDNAWGVIDEYTGDVCGAIILTKSKHSPVIGNLQLLHTFGIYRGVGVAKALCEYVLGVAYIHDYQYFRVSAEPSAIKFYEKIGLKFLGEQRSKCQLSMFKITGYRFKEGIYDINDPIINKAVYRKGKGGCVKVFNND